MADKKEFKARPSTNAQPNEANKASFQGFKITEPIPNRFMWKSRKYEFDKLTAADVKRLAEDTDFNHIEIDEKPASPAKPN